MEELTIFSTQPPLEIAGLSRFSPHKVPSRLAELGYFSPLELAELNTFQPLRTGGTQSFQSPDALGTLAGLIQPPGTRCTGPSKKAGTGETLAEFRGLEPTSLVFRVFNFKGEQKYTQEKTLYFRLTL